MSQPINNNQGVDSIGNNIIPKEEVDTWYVVASHAIETWKRHQRFKPLLTAICLLWVGLIVFVDVIHQQHVSHHIRDELDTYSCTVIDESRTNVNHMDCNAIELTNTYYYYIQNNKVYTRYVNCTDMGAYFRYNSDIVDDAADNYYLKFFLGIVGPILLTYFVLELSYLAYYDMLSIVREGDEIVISKYIWRVGIDLMVQINPKFPIEFKGGIEVPFDLCLTSFYLQYFVMGFGIPLLFQNRWDHCTYISTHNYGTLDIAAFFIIGVYGVFWLISAFSNMCDSTRKEDLDILIAKYKQLFIRRRFRFRHDETLSKRVQSLNCFIFFVFIILQFFISVASVALLGVLIGIIIIRLFSLCLFSCYNCCNDRKNSGDEGEAAATINHEPSSSNSSNVDLNMITVSNIAKHVVMEMSFNKESTTTASQPLEGSDDSTKSWRWFFFWLAVPAGRSTQEMKQWQSEFEEYQLEYSSSHPLTATTHHDAANNAETEEDSSIPA